MHLVHRGYGVSDTRHKLSSKLEAQIHALGADVEQQVARRRHRMARSGANLPEWMQLCGSRRPKEPVPRVGPKTHDARKAPFKIAKFDRAHQRGKISAERAHGGAIVNTRVECCDQEDRNAGKRRGYRLRLGRQASSRLGRAHRIGLHPVSLRWRARNFALPNPTLASPCESSGRKLTIACRRTSNSLPRTTRTIIRDERLRSSRVAPSRQIGNLFRIRKGSSRARTYWLPED